MRDPAREPIAAPGARPGRRGRRRGGGSSDPRRLLGALALLAVFGLIGRYASGWTGARFGPEEGLHGRVVAVRDGAGSDFAANGGEDYELLAALPPEIDDAALGELAAACGVELAVVGHCTAPAGGIRLVGPDGREHGPSRSGFDHFAPGPGRRRLR